MGIALDLNELVSNRIETEWRPAHDHECPVEMPNQYAAVDKTKPAWARFTFLTDFSPEWDSAGPGSSERHFGRLQLEIFTRLGEGRNLAFTLADAWAALWRPDADGVPAIADVTFQPTQILAIGRTIGDPASFKVDCLTAFERSFQP